MDEEEGFHFLPSDVGALVDDLLLPHPAAMRTIASADALMSLA